MLARYIGFDYDLKDGNDRLGLEAKRLAFKPGEIYNIIFHHELDKYNKPCVAVVDMQIKHVKVYNPEMTYQLMSEWRFVSQPKWYKVITLCGSTRFKLDFRRIEKSLARQNYVVLNLGIFGHYDNDTQEDMPSHEDLASIHFQRIDMSDAIFVIDKNEYIGPSTSNEVQYAKNRGMKIFYMSERPDGIITEEDWK